MVDNVSIRTMAWSCPSSSIAVCSCSIVSFLHLKCKIFVMEKARLEEGTPRSIMAARG